MDVYLGYLHGCYSSTVSTGEPAGTWTPYPSLLWSLHDILLVSPLYSLLRSLLDACMTARWSRAAAGRCIHWQQLSFPQDAFGWWKFIRYWKVWHECWRTESIYLSAPGTMITITNTFIVTIISMAIIPLPSSLSALDWMCIHSPTICRLQAADCARKSESDDRISFFFSTI